jgi:hypothetical protein
MGSRGNRTQTLQTKALTTNPGRLIGNNMTLAHKRMGSILRSVKHITVSSNALLMRRLAVRAGY